MPGTRREPESGTLALCHFILAASQLVTAPPQYDFLNREVAKDAKGFFIFPDRNQSSLSFASARGRSEKEPDL